MAEAFRILCMGKRRHGRRRVREGEQIRSGNGSGSEILHPGQCPRHHRQHARLPADETIRLCGIKQCHSERIYDQTDSSLPGQRQGRNMFPSGHTLQGHRHIRHYVIPYPESFRPEGYGKVGDGTFAGILLHAEPRGTEHQQFHQGRACRSRGRSVERTGTSGRIQEQS